MSADEMFRMAVRLVEANINAGQFMDTINFETIVFDQVNAAFMALDKSWSEINRGEEQVH